MLNPFEKTTTNDIAQFIVQSRAGGRTERCHNIPHHSSYNVAAHSWGVAMLLYYIWPEDFPRLAIYCLTHDVPEAWVGDIPSPTLTYTPGLKSVIENLEIMLLHKIGLRSTADLPKEDQEKIRACDQIEFWLWAKEQQAHGNKYVQEAITEVERYFREEPLPELAQKVFFELFENVSLLPKQQGVLKELNNASK
jgi:5'-deoxynucleotidase YfbR-like HD superfamily hydrolase